MDAVECEIVPEPGIPGSSFDTAFSLHRSKPHRLFFILLSSKVSVLKSLLLSLWLASSAWIYASCWSAYSRSNSRSSYLSYTASSSCPDVSLFLFTGFDIHVDPPGQNQRMMRKRKPLVNLYYYETKINRTAVSGRRWFLSNKQSSLFHPFFLQTSSKAWVAFMPAMGQSVLLGARFSKMLRSLIHRRGLWRELRLSMP